MSKARIDTLATRDDSEEVPVSTVVNGSAKAWVNFNGSGTIVINKAFNVSSVVDLDIGDYGVNLSTPLPDADYADTGSVKSIGNFYMYSSKAGMETAKTSAYYEFSSVNTSGAQYDNSIDVSSIVFR